MGGLDEPDTTRGSMKHSREEEQQAHTLKLPESMINTAWRRSERKDRYNRGTGQVRRNRSRSRSRSRDREEHGSRDRGAMRDARRRRHEREDEEGETDFEEVGYDDVAVKKQRRAEVIAQRYAARKTELKEREEDEEENEEESIVSPIHNPMDDTQAFLSPSGQLLVAAMSINGKRRHDEDDEEGEGEGGSDAEDGGGREDVADNKNSAVVEKSARQKSLEVDLFSDSPEPDVKPAAAGASAESAGAGAEIAERVLEKKKKTAHLQSNFDDEEGYYTATVGEVIGQRYRVLGVVGRGVFSCVLKCADTTSAETVESQAEAGAEVGENGAGEALLGAEQGRVAIKVVRSNETMKRAAVREVAILRKLRGADPKNHKFVVRLLDSTEHMGHPALVFEAYSMNLRQALHKFGKHVGISVSAVRLYARQLLVALKFLRQQKVVHADLKLDNILCSGDLKVVKLCDFGSAFEEADQVGGGPAPFLVSRFYRAPEVILGLSPLNGASDLFSLAVCLFELYTGTPMFPGRTNSDMLRLMLRCKGALAPKVIKAHLRAYDGAGAELQPHFDAETLQFLERDEEGNVLRAVVVPESPASSCSVASMLKAGISLAGTTVLEDEQEAEAEGRLAGLIDECLTLNPSKRILPSEALLHPFFSQE